jgi:hypothetical protein
MCSVRHGPQPSTSLPRYPGALGRSAAIACLVSILFATALHAEPAGVAVELNKLESQGGGCRAYLVVNNESATQYQTLKLDLVLFQPDGVIGRRFAIDLAPLKPSKRAVKLFDLDGVACDKIGSFLINEVVDCKTDAGPATDCLAAITVKSLTSVQLTK